MPNPRIVGAPYGQDLWKCARIDTRLLAPAQREEILAWLSSLGIAYREYTPTLAVTQDTVGGQLLLHLSRFVMDPFGDRVIDHAAARLHTTPVAIAISTYPSWLPGVSLRQEEQAAATKEVSSDDSSGSH